MYFPLENIEDHLVLKGNLKKCVPENPVYFISTAENKPS